MYCSFHRQAQLPLLARSARRNLLCMCVGKTKKGAWQGPVNVILPRIPAVPGTEIPLGRYVGIHRLSSGTLINYISPHVQ